MLGAPRASIVFPETIITNSYEPPCECPVQMLLAIFPVRENGFVNTIVFEREKNYLFVGTVKCKVSESFPGWQSSFSLSPILYIGTELEAFHVIPLKPDSFPEGLLDPLILQVKRGDLDS